jgi:hypothetical protein
MELKLHTRGQEITSDSLKSICDQAASIADGLVMRMLGLKIKDDERNCPKKVALWQF